MQLQFEKQEISCLHTVKRELQTQEQTQELRISDGMPDIGNVIGAWGQVILRSKEWQDDGMLVSGGTMVCVQYQPEEGTDPQWVESWLPFQMRWSFPKTQRDGTILTQCCLRSVDARSTSARKLMLRTNVSVLAWAMEEQACPILIPGDVPEDIQLRRVTYPVRLPREAGEKAFSLEESLSLPPSVPKPERVIRVRVQPQITEEKLMNDKVVFRGNALLQLLYLADDGGVYSWDFELPFTQYSELEREYGENAEALLWPCVTALEAQWEEDRLQVKAGLVCQYRISDRQLVEVVEDAYSTRRSLKPVWQELPIPAILEQKSRMIHAQTNASLEGMRLTDVQFRPYPVQVEQKGENAQLTLSGQFQMLYYDMQGKLCCATQRWEDSESLPADGESLVEAVVLPGGNTQGSMLSGSAQLNSDFVLETHTVRKTPFAMVSGLELGELREQESQRPSLILRRSRGQSLWEIAKETGSTEAAIRQANQLQDAPEETTMLLIPVL